ncbi:MAG: IS1634 family transposase [Deltaproteobacteria bacterium]|jgi:transposase|nr:IS1634 family transposase [Deltaproteobacteria bacterium]
METTQAPTSADNSKPPKIREQIINGVRYVYQDHPFWDKNKKQARHKRVYIGHYDKDGKFVDSKKLALSSQNDTNKNNFAKTCKFVGATILLNTISKAIGLYDDLKTCYPLIFDKILSLAYYLVMKNTNQFHGFNKWEKFHVNPFGKPLFSQKISELLSDISEDQKINFFKLQIQRRLAEEYLVYDTTSIFSYSEMIKKVKYSHNKEGDNLPQINLALIIGEKSLIPVYYKLLSENINDLTTIKNFIIDTKFLEMPYFHFFMDRGFYSAENINNLASNEYKFIIGVKNNISIVSNFIDNYAVGIDCFDNLLDNYDVYSHSKMIYLPFKTNDKSEIESNYKKFRSYLHIYYDPQLAYTAKISFQKKVKQAIKNFYDNKASSKELILINKYCIKINHSNNLFKLKINNEIVDSESKKFGFFSLISNYIKDSKEALSIYRNKDIIDKSFANLKGRFNLRRPQVHSDENYEGALFIQFIALVITFHIHNKMKINNLYSNYSLEELLGEIDSIQRFEYEKDTYRYSEITKKQIEIFNYFDININEIINN